MMPVVVDLGCSCLAGVQQAKTQAECYHYLFKLAVEMHRLGLDFTKVSDQMPRRHPVYQVMMA